MRHYDSPRTLHVVPFAALGLLGGILTATFFDALGSSIGRLVMGVTPITAGLLGAAVGAVRRRWAVATILLGMIAGVLNGTVIGLIESASGHHIVEMGFGAWLGVWCAPGFLPPLVVIAWAARRVGRARLGSLIDGIDRRAVWCAVAWTAVACTLWLRLSGSVSGTQLSQRLVIVGGIGAAALLYLLWNLGRDLTALARAEEAVRLASLLKNVVPAPAEAARSRHYVDLGLGDEQHHQIDDGTLYRTAPSIQLVLAGSPAEAKRVTRRAVIADAAGIASVLATMLIQFLAN
jgi:hypothetical protein